MKMETVLIWLSYQEEEEQPQLFHQMSQTTYVYIQSPAADIGIMTLVHKEAKVEWQNTQSTEGGMQTW